MAAMNSSTASQEYHVLTQTPSSLPDRNGPIVFKTRIHSPLNAQKPLPPLAQEITHDLAHLRLLATDTPQKADQTGNPSRKPPSNSPNELPLLNSAPFPVEINSAVESRKPEIPQVEAAQNVRPNRDELLRMISKELQKLQLDTLLGSKSAFDLIDYCIQLFERLALAKDGDQGLRDYIRSYLIFNYFINTFIMIHFNGFAHFMELAKKDFIIYLNLYNFFKSDDIIGANKFNVDLSNLRELITNYLSSRKLLSFDVNLLFKWLDEYVDYMSSNDSQKEDDIESAENAESGAINGNGKKIGNGNLSQIGTQPQNNETDEVVGKERDAKTDSSVYESPLENRSVEVHSGDESSDDDLKFVDDLDDFGARFPKLANSRQNTGQTAAQNEKKEASKRESVGLAVGGETPYPVAFHAFDGSPLPETVEHSKPKESHIMASGISSDMSFLKDMSPVFYDAHSAPQNLLRADLSKVDDGNGNRFGFASHDHLPSHSVGPQPFQSNTPQSMPLTSSLRLSTTSSNYQSAERNQDNRQSMAPANYALNQRPHTIASSSDLPVSWQNANQNGTSQNGNLQNINTQNGNPQIGSLQNGNPWQDHGKLQYLPPPLHPQQQLKSQANVQKNAPSQLEPTQMQVNPQQVGQQQMGQQQMNSQSIHISSIQAPMNGHFQNGQMQNFDQRMVRVQTQPLFMGGAYTSPPIERPIDIARRLGICGLKNPASTCYINLILQVVAGIPNLLKCLVICSKRAKFGRLSRATMYLLDSMRCSGGQHINPVNFLSVLAYMKPTFNIPNAQQDAQELLLFILDQFHEENCTKATNDDDYLKTWKIDVVARDREAYLNWYRGLVEREQRSIFNDMFQGHLQDKLRCNTCGYESVLYSLFTVLSLPIPHVPGRIVDLKDCLLHFTKDEVLYGDNAWQCPECKKKTKASKADDEENVVNVVFQNKTSFWSKKPATNKNDAKAAKAAKTAKGQKGKSSVDADLSKVVSSPKIAIKSLTFIKLPPVLFIQFSRFSMDGGADKLNTDILYPLELTFNNENHVIRYRLVGLINHFGTLKSGHYTSLVNKAMASPEEREPCWCYFDDQKVKFRVHHGVDHNGRSRTVHSTDVYVLCYYRV